MIPLRPPSPAPRTVLDRIALALVVIAGLSVLLETVMLPEARDDR